jgi:tRNA U54 and U55 pseudouridine synthase Pus10
MHALQKLVEAAAAAELHHFALGAMFAPKFTTAKGLSNRERGEIAEAFVAWKAADKALADYRARRRRCLGTI